MSAATEMKRQEIQRRVRETSTKLANKLELLHHRVLGPMQTAQHAVSTAKNIIDTTGLEIAKRPWLSVAGGVIAGLGTGWLMGKSKPEVQPVAAFAGPVCAACNPEQTRPTLWQRFLSRLTGHSIGASLAVVRDSLKQHVPDWSIIVDQVSNTITSVLGGVPYRDPIIPTPPFVTPAQDKPPEELTPQPVDVPVSTA